MHRTTSLTVRLQSSGNAREASYWADQCKAPSDQLAMRPTNVEQKTLVLRLAARGLYHTIDAVGSKRSGAMPLFAVTRLRVRSWLSMPGFAWFTWRSLRQARRAAGNFGVAVRKAEGLAFWTADRLAGRGGDESLS